MTKTVTIVGGGLAGVTLGIGLRQRGVRVTLWEAGHIPRHRVCGELISGRGLETLDRLALRARLEAAACRDRTHRRLFFRDEQRSASNPARPRTLFVAPYSGRVAGESVLPAGRRISFGRALAEYEISRGRRPCDRPTSAG